MIIILQVLLSCQLHSLQGRNGLNSDLQSDYSDISDVNIGNDNIYATGSTEI